VPGADAWKSADSSG